MSSAPSSGLNLGCHSSQRAAGTHTVCLAIFSSFLFSHKTLRGNRDGFPVLFSVWEIVVSHGPHWGVTAEVGWTLLDWDRGGSSWQSSRMRTSTDRCLPDGSLHS